MKNEKRYTLRQVVILLVLAFCCMAALAYANATVPNSFTAGTTISAKKMNQNFSALAASMPAIKTAVTSSVMIESASSSVVVDIMPLTVDIPLNGTLLLFAQGTAHGTAVSYSVEIVDAKTNILGTISLAGNAVEPYSLHGVADVLLGQQTFTLRARFASPSNGQIFHNDLRLTALLIPNTM
ncbi:MAG: hypothetical protein M0042_04210 [Nitrospiraceae bacterium]|nr:hypothetical protein [Nitrospiraceae bacterium]